MTKSWYAPILAAAVMAVGTILFLWLRANPWSGQQFLAITTITNGVGQFSYIFCVTSTWEYSVILFDGVVQVRTPYGWRTSNHFELKSPGQRADPSGTPMLAVVRSRRSKQVVADIPQNPGTFRFGVLYAPEARYPRLLGVKLSQAIYSRSLAPFSASKPGDYTGSNMCFSAEVRK